MVNDIIIRDTKPAEELLEFLRESNAIEGVYDDDSLDQALHAWAYLIMEKQLTPHVILKTHKILMLHQKLQPDQKGYFRKVRVWVGGREGQDWHIVPTAIKEWCKVVNANVQAKFLDSYKMCHISYEKIHPFVDGNGRTGRMFMNWQRLRMDLPLLIIHEGEEQMDYYKWFQ